MENLEWILSLAGTVLLLLSAAVGFLVKLVKAVKERDAEGIKNALNDAAKEAVAFAEKIKEAKGEAKKTIALTQIRKTLAAKGMQYDERAASDAVEALISLSKEVNAA